QITARLPRRSTRLVQPLASAEERAFLLAPGARPGSDFVALAALFARYQGPQLCSGASPIARKSARDIGFVTRPDTGAIARHRAHRKSNAHATKGRCRLAARALQRNLPASGRHAMVARPSKKTKRRRCPQK